VDIDGSEHAEDRRAWLTFKGDELLDATEVALLDAQRARDV
jgi:hypothetical protein